MNLCPSADRILMQRADGKNLHRFSAFAAKCLAQVKSQLNHCKESIFCWKVGDLFEQQCSKEFEL